jgi:uncharacterized membrane protein
MGEGMNRRWHALDGARGIAIVAMILFHFTWDLGFFGIIDYDISFTSEGRMLSHGIAGSFLFIVGMSLVLANRATFDAKAFLRRFRFVAGAAFLVSLGTFFAMPDDWIFFGVLHCIALSSLLAIPWLRAPLGVVAVVAACVLFAPFLVSHPIFDQPWLFWLGLNHVLPRTNDYVPLFPWFGVVLCGVFAARLALRNEDISARLGAPLTGWFFRRLARLGRFSLPVYLLHQPVMMGLIWGLLSLTGPIHLYTSKDGGFAKACTASCIASGKTDVQCTASCACVGEELARGNPPVATLSSEALSIKVDEAVAVCRVKGLF